MKKRKTWLRLLSLVVAAWLLAAAPAAAFQDLYLDFIGDNPHKGKPIKFKSRCKTGNACKVEFQIDSLCPQSYSVAGKNTIYTWSYVNGTITFGQAGECKVLVSYRLVDEHGGSRILDREFLIYVMQ